MRTDDIKALNEQRLQLVQEVRTLGETAEAAASENGGEWDAEDKAKLDRYEQDLTKINQRLESAYRVESLTRWNPEESVTITKDGAPQTLEEYRAATLAQHRVADQPDVRNAVYSWLVKGREGMDLDEYRVLSKAASGGGYLVPTDMAAEVVRALRFLPGGVGALGRTISTASGDTFNVPLNLTHGSAAWIAESGSYTPSDETMTQAVLSAFKAGTKIIVSEELLTDTTFDLSGFITREFGERIGALAEAAYISGDGSGKPTGILDAASAVTVVNLPAGQVTTLTAAAILTAVYSIPAQYRENMAILVSDSLWVRLLTLVDTTGRPIWAPSLSADTPDRLSGIPIYTHPNLAASGANAKSMIVGDFSKGYWIRRVDGIYMQRQNELHSDSGQVGFRAYLRLDGKVVLADALRVVAFAAT